MLECSHIPSTRQITMASERPLLALLDLALELSIRTLHAEHPMLEDDAHRGSAEPPPPHRALAASVVILAKTLREALAGYCEQIDHLRGDANDDQPF
jgi:hypothetical protein